MLFLTFLCSEHLFLVHEHVSCKAGNFVLTPCFPAASSPLFDIAPVAFLLPYHFLEVSFQIEFSPSTCCSWLFVHHSPSFLKPDIFVWLW